MNEVTEEWARTAKAGRRLDRVCAEWMGFLPMTRRGLNAGWVDPVNRWIVDLPKFSTRWGAAGMLLEAMSADLVFIPYGKWSCAVDIDLFGVSGVVGVTSFTPQLAIARACAVLVAGGVTKEALR